MKKIFFSILIICVSTLFSCKQNTKKGDTITLKYASNETPTYEEIIEMYQKLDHSFREASLLTYGPTDAGKPLHLFVISKDRNFNAASAHKNGKTVVLINNGIHPGEPCGIDASLQFTNDLLNNKDNLQAILENTVICIIPVYNIGGTLNRSAFHRTGQIGPKETGFRGNAKNLDLNRDFVKCDTRNAISFSKIFQEWKPQIFLDTHTTNGAEHQYTITLIPPQPNSMLPIHEKFLREKMLPDLYGFMANTDYEMIPYVYSYAGDPADGIVSYVQYGKYSSGYARLFNSLGFMTENHVYKSYYDRVMAAYEFIRSLTRFSNENSVEINRLKAEADKQISNQEVFTIQHALDTSRYDMIEFKGYEAGMFVSPLTGQKRFGFDLSKPYTKEIRFYDYYHPVLQVTKPDYYILPQAWKEVIERLKINQVNMIPLDSDTALEVEVYYITGFENERRQNNGHLVHRNIEVQRDTQIIKYYAGDMVIPMNQPANRYLIEMLEPQGAESFLAWNFFDPCLETREYFSSYGFEENAINYLKEHPEFMEEFEAKRERDPAFAKNHRAQLAYIYHNTEWDEISYRRYPVARYNGKLKQIEN